MVVPSLPRLEAAHAQLPDEMFVGEVYEGCCELKNQGCVGLRSLQVAVSSPDVVFGMLEDESKASLKKVLEVGSGSTQKVYTITTHEEIAGGTSASCPVCIHPSVSGNHMFHCLFRYESVDDTGSVRLRYLQHSFAVKVQHALKIGHSIRAADLSRVAYLLTLDVVNNVPNQDIHIQSATPIHGDWDVLIAGCNKITPTGDSTKIDQLVQPKKQARVFLSMDPKETKQGIYHPDNPSTDGASALELLQRQRIKSAVDCSTSGTDSFCISVKWSMSNASARNSIDRPTKTRWGYAYCCQSVQKVPNPIHISVAGSLSVKHKFSGSPVCSVSLLVSVTNTTKFSASVSIEAGSKSGDMKCGWSKSSPANLQEDLQNEMVHTPTGHSPIQTTPWCLQTRKIIPVLVPGGCVSVPLVLALFRPGHYRVTDYLCSWTIDTSPAEHGVTDGPPIYLSVLEE